jgi:uncharacterized protein (DUF302 family)
MTASVDLHRRAVLRGTAAGAAALAADAIPANAQTANIEVRVERVGVTSKKSFDAVVAAFESAIGRPDMNAFTSKLNAAKRFDDIERVVRHAVGQSGLMEFAQFNLGFILQKEHAGAPKSLRFLVGNPLIMKQLVEHVPDAGSYAPVTILIDERPDGVHLSYDKMASFLAPYGNAESLKVAQDLDAKVEKLLRTAAASS